MRRTTRRKLDAGLLAGGAVVLAGAAVAGAWFGRPEQVSSLWALAEVNGDGSAQVTEVVDYDFGPGFDRHGIFRTVPDLDPSAPITVSSPDAPDGLQVSSAPEGTRLQIGDPDQTVSGRRRYEIHYPLPGMVRGEAVAWDAVGTAWEVPIDQVELHVLTPFELLDPTCVQGPAGSSTACDDVRVVEPGHLVATVDRLSDHEGATVRGRVGPALAATPVAPGFPGRPDDPGTGLLLPAVAAAAAALVASAGATGLVRRAGRERVVVGVGGPADAAWAGVGGSPNGAREVRVDERELEAMATTDFAPPEGLSPAQGGIVLTEDVRPEHKVAWLIDAAIEGSIDLVEDEPGVRLIRRGPGSPATGPILDIAFDGRPEVMLGTYDSHFASGWAQLSGWLDSWRGGSGLWDERAGARRILAIVLGAIGAIAGLAVAALGGALANTFGAVWLAVVALGGLVGGAGLAAAIGSWELRVRTAAGSAAWLRVESFRRFLAASEAYHAEEAAKRGVLREYTAWAVAVGEIGRWAAAVGASTVIPASAGLGYAFLAPTLMASTTSTATAPSSSGSGWSGGGGFSGGGVGGGAGGGGGGSW